MGLKEMNIICLWLFVVRSSQAQLLMNYPEKDEQKNRKKIVL